MRFLKRVLPDSWRRHYVVGRYMIAVWRNCLGVAPRECPMCGFRGRFLPQGQPPRFDARCPRCRSLDRHRLMHFALESLKPVKPGDRVIHFAPEPAIARMIQAIGVQYESADIQEGKANTILNIEDIALPDASADVVVVSHVLEHVNDRKALAELYRVLKPGGRAILAVPIIEGWDETYENLEVTSPAERTLHFGQRDHVRYYGRDFRDRVRQAGFELTEFSCPGLDAVRYGLSRGERIFVGSKSS